MDRERVSRLGALVREEIDWNGLIDMANRQGVLPLLYWNLNANYPDAVPEAISTGLREGFCANTRRNLFLLGELLQIASLFAEHEVPVIPYKGPILAAIAYGNLSLRQFGDLDIIVRERDVFKAKDLLLDRGYRPLLELTEAQEIAYIQSCHAYNFVKHPGGIVVELHWQISDRQFSFLVSGERLWERLDSISLAGKTVLNLLPETLLVVLCQHGSVHRWEQLKWICDIAESIRARRDMDWERLFTKARELGSVRMLCLGLFLASDLLDAELPEVAWREIDADRVVKWLANRVSDRLFGNAGDSLEVEQSPLLHLRGRLNRAIFHLRMRERWRDRLPYLRYLFGIVVFPNEKDSILPLPQFLRFVRYLFRPLRLVKKYGVKPLQNCLEDWLLQGKS